MTLPVDYTNATVSADLHPAAHNDVNAAVNALAAAAPATPAVAGRWFPAWTWMDSTTNALAAGNMRLTRTILTAATNAFSAQVTSGGPGGTTVTAFVYNCAADGTPSTRRTVSSPVDASGNGAATCVLGATVPAGIYWVGILGLGGSANYRSSQNGGNPLLFTASTTNPTDTYNCWQVTGLGSVPDPFSGSPAISTNMPYLFARAA